MAKSQLHRRQLTLGLHILGCALAPRLLEILSQCFGVGKFSKSQRFMGQEKCFPPSSILDPLFGLVFKRTCPWCSGLDCHSSNIVSLFELLGFFLSYFQCLCLLPTYLCWVVGLMTLDLLCFKLVNVTLLCLHNHCQFLSVWISCPYFRKTCLQVGVTSLWTGIWAPFFCIIYG